MGTSVEQLLSLEFPQTRQRYAARDCIMYALGLGIGADPVDAVQLRYVYEKDLSVLPTMGVVLAHPGFWARDLNTGLDWVKIVHAEQRLEIHRPLPVESEVIGKSRIVDVVDKGPDKGLLVYYERGIYEAGSADPLCTSVQTVFCRGDGGIGGSLECTPAPHTLPSREPDAMHEFSVMPQAALWYRLSGDLNPLHADPEIARQAGYERPILHGLATYGMAAWSIICRMCDGDGDRLKSVRARFTAAVYPGDVLATELWRDQNIVSFAVKAKNRDTLVLSNGMAEII